MSIQRTAANAIRIIEEVAEVASYSATFSDYFNYVHKNIKWQGIMTKDEFDRVVSIHSIDLE